jgi:ribose-phosphate pyrophosphokinase
MRINSLKDDAPRIIAGRSNPALAQGIVKALGLKLVECEITNFSDGETFCQIQENIRGGDIFIIQSTSPPVNDNLMELLLLIDAVKRASGRRITAVMPYFGYARQDRKVQSRTPISARLAADVISVAGIDRALFLDLHAGQIQGFFNKPVDHLYGALIQVEYIKKIKFENEIVVFSPDAGGVERARAFAKKLNCGLGIIDKRREAKNVAKAMHIIGEVKGMDAIIVDDMVDTAGTITEAATALMNAGASSVRACFSHGVLSGRAIERINNSRITELICTSSIDQEDAISKCSKLKVLDISGIFAEAIQRIHLSQSISNLFDY